MAAVLATAYVMGLIGLGAVARYGFIIAGMGCAWYYVRKSPWAFITITFWFWTLTPLVRRLIDYNAGFDSGAFLLVTPNLMAVFMFKDVLTDSRLLHQSAIVGGLLVLASATYGMVVSMVQGDVVPAMIASVDWIIPILYFFYFLCHADRIAEAEIAFTQFIAINAAIMFGYGLWQFLSPPPWDALWVIGSRLTTIGQPLPYELRVFGTLNSPGIDALWLSSVLLLLLHFRTRFSTLLAPLGLLVLLLTLVRVAVGSVALGLLIAAAFGRREILKYLVLGSAATVIIFFGVAAVDPAMTDLLVARFSTVEDLSSDTSAIERADLYRRSPAEINAHPLGLGLAAIGRTASAVHSPYESVDSGPIAIYLAMGWVAGSTYLLGLFLLGVQGLIAARRCRSAAALAMSVAAIGLIAILPFANVAGLLGVTLYTCIGYTVAVAISSQDQLQKVAPFSQSRAFSFKAGNYAAPQTLPVTKR